MNVCMLIYNYWPGPTGGAERQCRKLAHALVRNGHECRIVTSRISFSQERAEVDNGTFVERCVIGETFMQPVVRLGRRLFKRRAAERQPRGGSANGAAAGRDFGVGAFLKWLNTLLFIAGASLRVFRNRKAIDVLHVHTAGWIGGLGAWLGGRLGIPVVCKESTFPVLPQIEDATPFAAALRRWRSRSDFIAMNDAIAAAMKERGIPEARIHVVPNGVELPAAAAPIAENSGVLYVGNFSQREAKAFDVLVDAWAIVQASEPRATLTCLGGGDSSEWREYARQRGCGDSIDFPGFIDDPSGYYRKSALLVLPSRREGMSNALLEAQSWGIPAVVTDIPGNRAIVRDGENGVVVPVGDAEALAAGIVRLCRNADVRAAMGAAARRRVLEHYSMESVVTRLTALYGALASRRERGRGAA
jgi:glycosyltransferase involved in cell wall biosynthesis